MFHNNKCDIGSFAQDKTQGKTERIPFWGDRIVADNIYLSMYLFTRLTNTSTEYTLCHTFSACLHKDSASNTPNILMR